ncbi:MAG: hypothetical protein HFE78_05140 [Clostridiales bacterium]|nr:hypothetical protein [Clostridiales bacterium]
MIIMLYDIILVAYDLVVFKRPISEMASMYVMTVLVGGFVWFGMRWVLWIQIVNKMCPDSFLNILSLAALIVFGVSSVLMGIQYFLDGFLVMAFVGPVAFLSVIQTQLIRWKKRGLPEPQDD